MSMISWDDGEDALLSWRNFDPTDDHCTLAPDTLIWPIWDNLKKQLELHLYDLRG